MSSIFSLPPPVFLVALNVGLGLILPIVIILAAIIYHGVRRLSKPAVVTIFILIIVAGIFVPFTIGSYQVYVEVDESYLKVSCPPYATRILHKEDVVKVFVVDWNMNGSYRPILRTSGTSLGSYKIGWFKLNNEASALLVASSSRNLCLQTNESYCLLLSPPNFEEFLETVNNTFASIEI